MSFSSAPTRWPCFYVPSKKHHHRKSITICSQEACKIHYKHHNTPNVRLLCCHHANSRKYKHFNASDIWNRFESAHKETGIYSLYLNQWLSNTMKKAKSNEKNKRREFAELKKDKEFAERKEREDNYEEEESEDEDENLMPIEKAEELLQLGKTYTADDIQKAYRKQALLNHPDVFVANNANEEKKVIYDSKVNQMQQINAARDRLIKSL